jgi:hypothetical protein
MQTKLSISFYIFVTADSMDVDAAGKKYNPKTKQDENGQYPPWMNQRKIKQHKKTLKSKAGIKRTGGKRKKGSGAW